MKSPFLIILLGALFLSSCLKDKTIEPVVEPDGPCAVEVSYTTDIRPIIESSCKTQAGPGTGCHDAWIDNYSQINSLINTGSWQNRCFTLLDMPVMPNTWNIDSLSSDEIQTMECWIEQGYPEN
jgi:hypothetical protein